MSIYAFSINHNDSAFNPVSFDQTLSDDVIQKIKNESLQFEEVNGTIVRDINHHVDDKEVRLVTTKYLPVSNVTWLYDLLTEYVFEANKFFKFQLTGFMENIQFLHYGDDIGGGHYDWHMDCGRGIATRKLTVIVQLSDPADYEGCRTEILFNGMVSDVKGSVTIFPSYLPHRVLPLTSGKRDVLVAWVNGPTFS